MPSCSLLLDVDAPALQQVFQPGTRLVRTHHRQQGCLRAQLRDVPRAELDRALLMLSRSADAAIAPESNQKTLTPADRAASIRIGGQDKHLLAIG